MAVYYKITPTNEIYRVLTDKHHLSLEDMWRNTESDCVQMVSTFGTKKKYTLVLDEEGKLKGRWRNRIATKLFNNYGDFIVGTVVVVKTSGWATFKDEQTEEFEQEIYKIFPQAKIHTITETDAVFLDEYDVD